METIKKSKKSSVKEPSEEQTAIDKAMSPLTEQELADLDSFNKLVPFVDEEVKALQKTIFNMKFDYDSLLNFTCQLLTHEQHILFAAKKKEIFG